jgi:hypothetical protein
MDDPLVEQYRAMREQLKALQSEAVPDMPAIDKLIDELEQLQLHIKNVNPHHGNNPIE